MVGCINKEKCPKLNYGLWAAHVVYCYIALHGIKFHTSFCCVTYQLLGKKRRKMCKWLTTGFIDQLGKY